MPVAQTKILLVTDIFPPEIGGPATFIDRLACHLAAAGVRVTVVCASWAATHPDDVARPYRVRRVIRRRGWFSLELRLTLLWEMIWHRCILVNGLEFQAQQMANFTGRDFVLKIVGDTVWETARNRGETLLDIDQFQTDPEAQRRWRTFVQNRNEAVMRARLVFTPSDYLRRMVIGWGKPTERTRTILNGVELAEGRSPAPRSRQPGEPLRLLFVGRLTNWKGIETLLLALRETEGVQAEIAGDGPEYPVLVELSRQLGLGHRVNFLGRQSHATIATLMNQVHVLVLTSLYEGLSHTLLEAGAHGLPCIASRRGGNAEVIKDRVNGLLVEAQDSAALRAAILVLRDNETLRMRMAVAALEEIRNFDLRSTVAKVADLLNEK